MIKIRVLVADDDPAFVELLRQLIDETPGLVVVGTAGDGIEALQLTESLRPDVVTMDIDMPRLDGVEATRMILERYSETAVVLVSGAERDDLDYVRKSRANDEIVDAIGMAVSESRRLRLVHV